MHTLNGTDDLAAHVRKNGDEWMVIFGWVRSGEFVVRRGRGARYYKSQKAADYAASKWCKLV